jgi:hypothetical protein
MSETCFISLHKSSGIDNKNTKKKENCKKTRVTIEGRHFSSRNSSI